MQMTVAAYAQRNVKKEHRAKFYELMLKWDGGPSIRGAYYDMGVLRDRAQEAEDAN